MKLLLTKVSCGIDFLELNCLAKQKLLICHQAEPMGKIEYVQVILFV